MPDAHLAPQQKKHIIHATQEQQLAISRFLNQNHLTHRHLDWFSPMEWIGQQPFLIEIQQRQIQSLMLAAPEVPGVAWVRLFSTKDISSIESTWDRLLNQTITILQDKGIKTLAALQTSDWFTKLLDHSGFFHTNDVVVLEKREVTSPSPITRSGLDIRAMRPDDLAQVYEIDQSAFDPLWQNALASLTKAFQGQGLSTVALKHGKLIGYQISTWLGSNGHLARLAVDPDHQGQQVASALAADLLNRFTQIDIGHVTVNTQADNLASLTLYQKLGFQHTGEIISVYQRDL
jgi:ribosomal protein S18 acetylase RimI-like enzyme